MDRRKFIVGSSALALASIFPSSDADAFWWLLRTLGRNSLGRHMQRFSRAGGRLHFSGRYRDYGVSNQGGLINRRRRKAREVLAISQNARLLKNVGEIIFDNAGNGFPSLLNGHVSVVGGGEQDNVYCGSFISLDNNGNGEPVIMELAELIMLEEIGKQLPRIYEKQFASANEAISIKKVLSCIHPIAHIKNGEFDNDWNHITPLIYKTACGRVRIEMMEEYGKCIIERDDIGEDHIIPVRFASVDNQTGARS